jgi:F-type H+-transporting ATPase subunit b
MTAFMTLASEAPNGWFVPGDPKELYFGAAASLIVFFFLATKLFPIINKALIAQGDKVKAELDTAEAAQKAADDEVAALQAKLANAQVDAANLVTEAQAQAGRLGTEMAARAEADAAAVRARAQADAEAMHAQAGADLQAELTTKALAVAEEVARANLDDATQTQLIDQYIDQVGASS